MSMSNLFDVGSTIIRNEEPLTEVFAPTRLVHREGQRDYLASCLKPVVLGRMMRNVFLFGPTGVGKTSLVLWMFDELSSHTDNARTCYVNCWKSTSTHAILSKIVSELKIFSNPRRQTKELLEDIEGSLKKSGKKLIVALDEVDRLDAYDVLYDLSRSGCGIICISNDEYALADVDARIKSSLSLERLEFKAYTVNEMCDILEDRVNLSFAPGAVSPDVLKIAALQAEGDVRVGLEILRKAALFAEDEGLKKITKEHVIRAHKDAASAKTRQILETLNEHHKMLYSIVAEKGSLKSSDVLSIFNERTSGKVSERAYRNYMERLVTLKLVRASGDVRWREYSV
ncbi:MAG: AAA family ATPase [archaeon]